MKARWLSKNQVRGMVVALVLLVVVWWNVRDVPEGDVQILSVGPLIRVEYTKDGTTQIQSFSGFDSLYLCGDQRSTLDLGKMYRIQGQYIDHSINDDGLVRVASCLKLKNVEAVNEKIDLQRMEGVIQGIANLDRYSFAFDVHMKTDYGMETLNLCNGLVSNPNVYIAALPWFYSTGDVVSNQIGGLSGKRWISTIVYNKADRSARYGCYPMAALSVQNPAIMLIAPEYQPYFAGKFSMLKRSLQGHN